MVLSDPWDRQAAGKKEHREDAPPHPQPYTLRPVFTGRGTALKRLWSNSEAQGVTHHLQQKGMFRKLPSIGLAKISFGLPLHIMETLDKLLATSVHFPHSPLPFSSWSKDACGPSDRCVNEGTTNNLITSRDPREQLSDAMPSGWSQGRPRPTATMSKG